MESAENRPASFEAAAYERRLRERRAHVPITRVELEPSMARLSWNGVWGGFFIALGIWITLAALGVAIGISNLGSNVATSTIGRAAGWWLYGTALIALFFGSAFGSRLAMVVDGAVAWFEATLIWAFALVLTTAVATGLVSFAAWHPLAAQVATSAPTGLISSMPAAAWLTFCAIVVAWFAALIGSFWGRGQARGRAHQLGLAA